MYCRRSHKLYLKTRCNGEKQTDKPSIEKNFSQISKGCPKINARFELNRKDTVFSLLIVIFLLNHKVHRIGLFVE